MTVSTVFMKANGTGMSLNLLIYSESKEEGKDGRQGNSMVDV